MCIRDRDKDDNEFSDIRLEDLSLKLSSGSASEIAAAIQNEVQNFSFGTFQSDDITLVVLKIK